MADGVKNIQHRTRIIKLNFKQSAVTRGHGRVNTFVVAQQQFRTRFWRFRSANMRQMRLSSSIRSTSTSILPPLALRPKEPRRDHAGIIEDQQIAVVELIEQIGESTVRQRARRPSNDSKRQRLRSGCG